MPSGMSFNDALEPVPLWIRKLIHLYNRCAIFGTELALPCSGGILDQPESLMQILEIIHQAVQEDRIQRQDDEAFKAKSRENVNKVAGHSTKRM